MELTTKRSNFWYILPLVLGLLGGIIAYFVLRKSDSKKAKICLIIGIGISVIWIGASVANYNTSETNSKVPAVEKNVEISKSNPSQEVQTDTSKSAELVKTSDIEFDPIIVESAKKNIPGMQSLLDETLRQCKNVKSFEDYQIFILAVASLEDELTQTITNSDLALTVLELKGYDKHPEVGPLIKETRSLATETSQCLDDMIKKYDSASTTVQKSTSSPSYSKLYELLPSEEDLSSEWTILKSFEYNKATKDFYYENAGQTTYSKKVNFIKEFRMNVNKFYDSNTAAVAYDKKYRAVIDSIGMWESTDRYSIFASAGSVILDEKNCVIINIAGQNEDTVRGWCKMDIYLLYIEIEGFYPEMKKDAVDFMNIARQNVNSKT